MVEYIKPDYLDKFEPPKPLTSSRPLLRALLYGIPGAGKTTTAGHLIEERGLIVAADPNYVVLDKYPDVAKKVQVQPYYGLNQMRAIANAHTEGIKPWSDFDTLIWDPVSAAVQTTLRKLVITPGYRFEKQEMHKDIPTRPHYRILSDMLAETVDILNKSNLNIIYTTHMAQATDEEKKNGNFADRSNLPFASYMVLAQSVQLIGYIHKEDKGKPRMVQLEGTVKTDAKSQVPTLPEEETYTVQDIINGIHLWKSNYTREEN